MLQFPPPEREWISWLYVALCVLAIFLTVPVARTIQTFVADHWGRELFSHAVIALILVTICGAAVRLRRLATTGTVNYVWLLAVAAIFTAYTLKLRRNPEEAVHFVEYGLLGLLLARALSHRIGDLSIYATAIVAGTIVGTLDEALQWLTPRRFWDYADIGLNVVGTGLALIAVAAGLRPPALSGPPARVNVALFCRVAAALVGLLGLCLLNTPARVAWYAQQVPGLAFLRDNPSAMTEYGYRYVDAEIGVFRSRLAPSMLQTTDEQRAQEAANILARYRDTSTSAFLREYTHYSDPFMHELRIHLRRRDYYAQTYPEHRHDDREYRHRATISWRENRILDKYFPRTLELSGYAWSPATGAEIESLASPDAPYDSAVSRHLITRFSEAQAMIAVGAAIIVLLATARVIGRKA
ncbi:MAG: VanZ family protein [Gammaproteobacteria bacterium]